VSENKQTRPHANTSNYGWSLWHMSQAERAGNRENMQYHLACAQVRATLALRDEVAMSRGVLASGGGTWETQP
jgi:hypothetical protein